MEKKSLYEKIISLFFEEDERTEEERRKEDQAFNQLALKGLSLVFFFNTAITFYVFFKGKYELSGKLEIGYFVFTICFGLGALYFDRVIDKEGLDKRR